MVKTLIQEMTEKKHYREKKTTNPERERERENKRVKVHRTVVATIIFSYFYKDESTRKGVPNGFFTRLCQSW